MVQRNFIAALAALALAAGPALAANSDNQSPAQSGTHSSKHGTSHKGSSQRGASSSDHMADELNGKELANMRQGQGGMASPGSTDSGQPGAGSAAPMRQ